jgi:hypothetical protein
LHQKGSFAKNAFEARRNMGLRAVKVSESVSQSSNSIPHHFFDTKPMQQHIIRFLTHGRTSVVLLGVYLFMALVVMNYGSNTMNALAGKTIQPLDLHFSYTSEQVHALFTELNEKGRAFYALFELAADTAYPVVYTLFMCSLIGFGWKKVILAQPPQYWLLLLPLTTFIFDLLENICIVVLLRNYPVMPDNIVVWGSLFTSLKWTSAGIVGLTALAGLLKRLIAAYTKE